MPKPHERRILKVIAATAPMGNDALDNAVWTATTERIARYTVGIALDRNQAIGTGTLVRVDRDIFVLTALHVVAGYQLSQMNFWCRPDSAMIVRAAKDTTNADVGRFWPGEFFPITGIVANERCDIAYLKLDPAFVPARASEVYDVARSQMFLEWRAEDIGGTSLFVFGFPVDNYRVLDTDGQRQVHYLGCATLVSEYDLNLNGPKWPAISSRFAPTKDFIFRYYEPDEKIDPNGFSGSGVWVISADRAHKIWGSDPLLIGVVHTHFPEAGLLAATKLPLIFEHQT